VKFDIWSYLACELGNTNVLNDERIRASLDNRCKRASSFSKLMVENKSIKSNISSHTPMVQGSHDLGQLGQREAHLCPCGKVFETEVDCVSSCFDGGVELWPVAGRTHDFRFTAGALHHNRIQEYA
jgi:hypothetical protein